MWKRSPKASIPLQELLLDVVVGKLVVILLRIWWWIKKHHRLPAAESVEKLCFPMMDIPPAPKTTRQHGKDEDASWLRSVRFVPKNYKLRRNWKSLNLYWIILQRVFFACCILTFLFFSSWKSAHSFSPSNAGWIVLFFCGALILLTRTKSVDGWVSGPTRPSSGRRRREKV